LFLRRQSHCLEAFSFYKCLLIVANGINELKPSQCYLYIVSHYLRLTNPLLFVMSCLCYGELTTGSRSLHANECMRITTQSPIMQDVLGLLRSQQNFLELVNNLQAIVDFFNRRFDDARASESPGSDPAAGSLSTWSSVSK
jgi:hypothetical protein